ncbi:hypothetical protein [Streptomyces griseosporeus]|uniref:hypothetical protein n=1 Tax=Streptomyces griseosporeus TaxID=1910 RepID=UPI0019911837|nr:hypothetical protein [Streptomyces griseosporeus]GHF39903.1 hypothetical protein GCM10018783_05610 [Streptomyces griseosporeus]
MHRLAEENAVLWVAVSLLPLMSLLLLVADRLEERLLAPASRRHRHAARRRHLRLVSGGRRQASDKAETRPAKARAARVAAPRERSAA